MPESAAEIHARAAGALRMPPVAEWPRFPFEGDLRPRALQPPEPEPGRPGEGGVDCPACARDDSAYVWTDERWRLLAMPPGGLPLIVMLEPRAHVDAPGDVPDDMAREMGAMLARVERAVRSIGEIGRVQVCRWGEGLAHLHWAFIARPLGLPQVGGSLAPMWDDVLPPTPDAVWEDNVARVVRALGPAG
jgi:diadenosine tetraphosphate (Ap4A) HIT family hydrolase